MVSKIQSRPTTEGLLRQALQVRFAVFSRHSSLNVSLALDHSIARPSWSLCPTINHLSLITIFLRRLLSVNIHWDRHSISVFSRVSWIFKRRYSRWQPITTGIELCTYLIFVWNLWNRTTKTVQCCLYCNTIRILSIISMLIRVMSFSPPSIMSHTSWPVLKNPQWWKTILSVFRVSAISVELSIHLWFSATIPTISTPMLRRWSLPLSSRILWIPKRFN